MNEDELLKLAEQNGIDVVETSLPESGSMIVEQAGACTVGLDSGLRGPRKKARLAHELGHAMKGALYRAGSPLVTRSRCEYRANKWAFTHLVPLDQLEKICAAHLSEPLCVIAEEMDLPEDFLRAAIRYYWTAGELIRSVSMDRPALKDRELTLLRVHTFGKMSQSI